MLEIPNVSETPFPLTHGPGPTWAGQNAPLAQAKNWRRVMAVDVSTPGQGPRQFLLGPGDIFPTRSGLAHESVAKGVSSIRGS